MDYLIYFINFLMKTIKNKLKFSQQNCMANKIF